MRMYDAGKIIAGLIIFLCLITFPFWYNLGEPSAPPKLEIATNAKQCVENTAYMKTSHMQLLSLWRDWVVREGYRVYAGIDGKKYTMSLQNTCMSCHANKAKFCDQCHNYAGITPRCWDCHIEPKENR